MVQPATTDEDGETVAGWNGFNVLHTAAARVGGLDLGFVPGEGGADVAGILAGAGSGAIRLVYPLGSDGRDPPDTAHTFRVVPGPQDYQGPTRGAHGRTGA